MLSEKSLSLHGVRLPRGAGLPPARTDLEGAARTAPPPEEEPRDIREEEAKHTLEDGSRKAAGDMSLEELEQIEESAQWSDEIDNWIIPNLQLSGFYQQ